MKIPNLSFTTTFLEGKGGLRLVKTFKSDGTKVPYPNAKNFTSTQKEYPKTTAGLRERLKDMKHFASKGGCLLKGELDGVLVEQPRAGRCLTHKENSVLTLDIDGIEIKQSDVSGLLEARVRDKINDPKMDKGSMLDESKGKIGKHYLTCLADYILSHFDASFLQTSYFLHASSSMGVGGSEKVSMHIEFILDSPLTPAIQKGWLTGQNLLNDFFRSKLQLNALCMGLRLPLDRTVADNSKLIFIGHPNFEDVRLNPIEHEDRIFLVERNAALLNNKLITAPMQQLLLDQTDAAVKELRKGAGLKTKAKADVRRITRGEEKLEFLKNPDKVTVTIVDDSSDFVHANVGSGDSNGYWWPKDDPTLVYNFKSEPLFRLQDVDQEAYEWCLKNHAEFINIKKTTRYLGRRVNEKGTSSGFVTIAVNTETNVIHEITRHRDRASAEDWMECAGEMLGDVVSAIELAYDPTQDEVYQVSKFGDGRPKEVLNTYIESEVWRKRSVIGGSIPTYHTIAARMKQVCPSIMFLLTHIAGGSQEDAVHFINWLGFVAKYKRKPGTTWLFHGAQGTGKGVMWERIITPIFGDENVRETDITALEDKFDSSLGQKTMVLVDEFRHSEAQGSKRLESKLKQMATQEKYALRGMHTEHADSINRFNMIFFSNARDAMRVSEDDRRMNIAARQEMKLRAILASETDHQGEGGVKNLIASIKIEIQDFADFLYSMEVDEGKAREPRANEARQVMSRASRTRSEDFADAVKSGNVEFFIDLLCDAPTDDVNHIQSLRRGVADMVSNEREDGNVFVRTDALIAFYKEAIGDAKVTVRSLTKYFERHVGPTMKICRKRVNGKEERGFYMSMEVPDHVADSVSSMLPRK